MIDTRVKSTRRRVTELTPGWAIAIDPRGSRYRSPLVMRFLEYGPPDGATVTLVTTAGTFAVNVRRVVETWPVPERVAA